MTDLSDSQKQRAREAWEKWVLTCIGHGPMDTFMGGYAAGYKDGHAQATAEAYCFDPKRP